MVSHLRQCLCFRHFQTENFTGCHHCKRCLLPQGLGHAHGNSSLACTAAKQSQLGKGAWQHEPRAAAQTTSTTSAVAAPACLKQALLLLCIAVPCSTGALHGIALNLPALRWYAYHSPVYHAVSRCLPVPGCPASSTARPAILPSLIMLRITPAACKTQPQHNACKAAASVSIHVTPTACTAQTQPRHSHWALPGCLCKPGV